MSKRNADWEGQTEKRRKLKRRDSEQCVQRIISTNFAGWDPVDIDGRIINGRTLRGALFNARRDRPKKQSRVSAKVIADLKEEFAPQGGPTLVVADRTQTINPALQTALQQASATNPNARDRSPLQALLGADINMNQREAVGVLRSVMAMSPYTSDAVRVHMLRVLEYFTQGHRMADFATEVQVLSALWDDVLCTTYLHHKKHGLSTRAYVTNYLPCFHAVSTQVGADMQAISVAGGDWSRVQEEVHRCVLSTKFGKAAFKRPAEQLTTAGFTAKCEELCETLRKKAAPLTAEALHKLKALHPAS